MLAAVLLDVDFTLFRPGPELGPDGYRRVGARHGMTLDPARHADAREAALTDLQVHPELVHDEEIWIRFTEAIVVGMGGDPVLARSCAVDLVRQWERHENFFLYEDALPALAPGVHIHVHDIFLPHDYPQSWAVEQNRSWNEQYLVQALLMYTTAFRVEFGCAYAFHTFPELVIKALDHPKGHGYGGGSIWLTKVG